MNHSTAPAARNARRVWAHVTAAAVALALTATVALAARAGHVTPPAVPAAIQVPSGAKAFLVGHAVGTQNYVCLPSAASASGVAYALFTPVATLYDGDLNQVTTHFFSPNPDEPNVNPAVLAEGTIRATWQHSHDTSTVWGKVVPGNSSSDAAYVRPGAIPWLLVTAVGAERGTDGGGALAKTAYIQRVNTRGGVAPATGCASPADLGNQAFVPYTADYYFFRHH